MAVLNDKKIKEYLDNGMIGIEPHPTNIQIQPASVDLTLDYKYLKFRKHSNMVIDTKRKSNNTSSWIFTEDSPLVLHPHDFVLCQTKEYVKIPNNLLARVEGRSSFGRLGIAIHITAGFIDPGFEGNITLEITNLGVMPVILYPEQRICQIVFEELCDECEKPYGFGVRNKYQGQKLPTPSNIFKDK